MAANRYSIVFFGAIVVAGIATWAVFRTVEESKANSRIATSPVVIATRDIAEGLVIDRLALAVAQWPVPTVPPGTFTSIDSVAGRVARVPIFNGEPLVPGRLAPAGTGPGLEVKISPGKRAMGVRVNDVSSMSGMIQPNSRVDIMITVNQSDEIERKSAKLFMSNMRVLAMGAQVQRGEDGRPIQTTVATLEVTPEESERLLVAQSQGQIQLVLRGYGDPDSVVTRGATSSDVAAVLRNSQGRLPAPVPQSFRNAPRRLAAPAPQQPTAPVTTPVTTAVPTPPPAKPDSHAVRIIRGRTAEEKKFAKDSVRRDTIP
jgi:pilus assembly protein CpaB